MFRRALRARSVNVDVRKPRPAAPVPPDFFWCARHGAYLGVVPVAGHYTRFGVTSGRAVIRSEPRKLEVLCQRGSVSELKITHLLMALGESEN
jgi:hypothetical protein